MIGERGDAMPNKKAVKERVLVKLDRKYESYREPANENGDYIAGNSVEIHFEILPDKVKGNLIGGGSNWYDKKNEWLDINAFGSSIVLEGEHSEMVHAELLRFVEINLFSEILKENKCL